MTLKAVVRQINILLSDNLVRPLRIFNCFSVNFIEYYFRDSGTMVSVTFLPSRITIISVGLPILMASNA